MCKFIIFLLGLTTFCLHSEAKVFTRCELALELFLQGFPMDQLRDWVCLVETVSKADTAAVGPPVGGSRDWGLFQINDRYWCSTGNSPGKDCNVRCADLLSDDITKASDCAKMIYKRHNFKAWFGWTANCKGKPLPDISNCCL